MSTDTPKTIDQYIPDGLTAAEYAALAILCLDQAGLSAAEQKAVLTIIADSNGHIRASGPWQEPDDVESALGYQYDPDLGDER